jgi:amidophosphoribosyltransferase
LVAYERNEEEIAEILGCDWIMFQHLTDLEDSVREAGELDGEVHPQGEFQVFCFYHSFLIRLT